MYVMVTIFPESLTLWGMRMTHKEREGGEVRWKIRMIKEETKK